MATVLLEEARGAEGKLDRADEREIETTLAILYIGQSIPPLGPVSISTYSLYTFIPQLGQTRCAIIAPTKR